MINQYRTLELDKVLSKVSEFCSCEDSKNMILNSEISNDIDYVNKIISETFDAYNLIQRFGLPPFGGLSNIDSILKKANMGSTLTISEILKVKTVLRTIRSLSNWSEEKNNTEDYQNAIQYFNLLTPNRYIEENIDRIVISEDEISDNASPLLSDLRRKIHTNENKIKEQLYKFVHNQNYNKFLQDSIITTRNGRYVIPVRQEYRSEIPGLIHDTSSSGATLFVEPMSVVESNNKINILKKEEHSEIERILSEISSMIGSFSENIAYSYNNAVKLNVIFSKAQYGLLTKCIKPNLCDNGYLNLKKARHPLIEPGKVVPIDIEIGDKYKTLIITGPNTGGKTVSIKTIGLLSLMTMCGLLLPAEQGSTVSIFNNIFSDIGDEQSIEQSLSTFSSHMTNIVGIINKVNDKSLVLIDELGAGTDPVEGAALAISILEHLKKCGAVIAATTHYPELKQYALETQGVINACCEFDVKTLKPTYKLLIGIPGKSNAFSIVRHLGLDESIINSAENFIDKSKSDFENVISKLNDSKASLDLELAEVKSIREKAQLELCEIHDERSRVKNEMDEEIEKARKKAVQITERAKAEATRLLTEIDTIKKELSKGGNNIQEIAKRAKAELNKSIDDIDSIQQPFAEKDDFWIPPTALNIGDTVYIKSLNSEGIITSLKDKKGMYGAQIGSLKVKVDINDLSLKSKNSELKKQSVKRSVKNDVDSVINSNIKTEIDLRGKNIEESILELDSYFDHCLRMNLKEITVIHGKGTGALRNGIRAYLKSNKYVKTFRPGTFGEGEDGVSIVTLK